ncbi:MAG: restriction endonuclease subunit S [Gemmatimonadota bacterium]
MASEWRQANVGEIAATARNALVGGPFGSNLVSRDYSDVGVPVIRGQNMGGRWVRGEWAFVTEEKADSLRANLAYPGDIVFTQRGTLGQVSMVPPDGYERYVISQSQMKLTVEPTVADPLFIYYVFSGSEHQQYIRQNAIQTGVPHINLGILRETPLSLPPPYQQRAIAHILGTLDDKIELNRRMNETLEGKARALFKSWFVDFDPVRAKMDGRWQRGESLPGLPADLYDLFPDRLVESELGEMPEGWGLSELGALARQKRETAKPDEIDGGTPYIGLGHMPQRSIALGDWDIGDGVGSNKYRFARGDILFGKLRPYFHKVGVAPIGGVCSTDIVVIEPGEANVRHFVLSWVSSDLFVAYTNAGSTGTRMPRTSWKYMAEHRRALPTDPRPLAGRFGDVVSPAVERIVSGIHEIRSLAELRDTLLPKLISGELRLPDAEQIVEQAT